MSNLSAFSAFYFLCCSPHSPGYVPELSSGFVVVVVFVLVFTQTNRPLFCSFHEAARSRKMILDMGLEKTYLLGMCV